MEQTDKIPSSPKSERGEKVQSLQQQPQEQYDDMDDERIIAEEIIARKKRAPVSPPPLKPVTPVPLKESETPSFKSFKAVEEPVRVFEEKLTPNIIEVPPVKAIAPAKKLKPLGWEIGDNDEKAKLDAKEKENMLNNKRIELDKKRLERKMEKQRQKELKELEKAKLERENATKEEMAAQEEQKTTEQLLQEEEARCMESIKLMCSPTITFNLTSDQWAHRKEGVEQIQKFIEDSMRNIKNLQEDIIIHQFCAITIVLRQFFQDRVAPVYFAAYDCFRCLLNVFGKYLFDSTEVSYTLQSVIPPLINGMGGESTGTNRRTQREACRCVLRIARLTEIDGLGLIVQLLKVDTIAVRPRLALLKILLQEFSLDDETTRGSRLTLKLVFDMCEPALNNSDDKIRKAGVENISLAYSMVGNSVRQYICNVKPAMLKVLEEKFTEIDASKTGEVVVNKGGSSGLTTPSNEDSTLLQIQRDKEKKRSSSSKKGENIMSLLNPVVLTKTNKSSTGREESGSSFMNSLQNSNSSGSFLDQSAATKNKALGGGRDNAPYLSSMGGSGASSRRLSNDNPERDSPPTVEKNTTSSSNVYRGNVNLNRALFQDLAEGGYGNGGNNFAGGFTSPTGRQIEDRFFIRE